MNVRYSVQSYSLICKHKLLGGNHHKRGAVDHLLTQGKNRDIPTSLPSQLSLSSTSCQQVFYSHYFLDLLILATDH